MNTSKFVAPNTVFDSSVSFLRNVTFDSSVYLQGTTHITFAAEDAFAGDTPYALVVGSIGTDVSIQYRQLGTMAFETSTNYYSKPEVDVLISDVSTALDTRLDFIDTSIAGLDASMGAAFVKNANQDTSIAALDLKNQYQDTSIAALDLKNQNQDSSIAALDLSMGAAFVKNANQDSSISLLDGLIQNIDSSLDLYVAKSGDTMTGALIISNGGLQVAGDVSITSNGDLYVDGDTTIKGNLTINGSLYVVDVESIDVSSAYIHLNTGLTGTPPSSLQSGIVVGRGDEEPYVFLFDESQQTFRIGIAAQTSTGYLDASTQAVATRQDNPLADGIAYWNDTLNRFDTSTGFTAASVINHFAALDASVVQNRLDIADVSLRLANFSPLDLSARIWDTETSIGALDVYTQALDGSIDFLFAWDLAKDASIIRIDASLNDVVDITTIIDASLNQLYTDIADVSSRVNVLEGDVSVAKYDINNLETSVGILNTWNINQDTSIGVLNNAIFDLSSNKLDAVANAITGSDGEIFATEVNNIAYLRTIEASGGDIVVTQDASTIYISASAGTVSRYTDSFDPTSLTQYVIPNASSGMDQFAMVSVYENNQQVYPDIDVAANGDITIMWAPGSLSPTVKVIAVG